jgi:hypothetical protein
MAVDAGKTAAGLPHSKKTVGKHWPLRQPLE